MEQKIIDKLNELIEIENTIKITTDSKLSENTYYSDLLVTATVDRTLKLSRGFRDLILTLNSQCALIITRSLIDTIARLHGFWLIKGREREYVVYFLDPNKKFSQLKDNQKQPLKDFYLIAKLDETYNSNNIQVIYNMGCEYTHLSQAHLQASSYLQELEDGKYVEITAGTSRYDRRLELVSYINLTEQYIKMMHILLEELNSYFKERVEFKNNNPEIMIDCI